MQLLLYARMAYGIPNSKAATITKPNITNPCVFQKDFFSSFDLKGNLDRKKIIKVNNPAAKIVIDPIRNIPRNPYVARVPSFNLVIPTGLEPAISPCQFC